ncbi:pentapeptide repeat-containing protein [Oceanicoccus sagamiensis]|uniref:Potassium channel domain-containing protein n=1 Tax=Oceanicoccus sagamiensis TaxID=716816 RepID=A0A1X9NDK7_9GAMM|nr:pentapeptide repeat-containing protein [Oceanicoccus sagamiensis]ARN73037.1 hypothetical protein BST96_02285 [Oceanicoccus sagamiensis]
MPELNHSNNSDQREYWTTPNPDKLLPGTREQLEKWIKHSHDMRGFVLRRCDLSGINLAKTAEHPEGFNFQDADLYRADFSRAHLFSVDFQNACLMKANFSGANLHCANMENANLLGINLEHAKLDNIHWGDTVIQEQQAIVEAKKGNTQKATDLYLEAEESYRNLRINLERAGLFEVAGHFFHREMVMRRKRMPRFSVTRSLSLIVDLLSGYGERPLRVVAFSLCFIVFCASCYFFSSGILYQGMEMGFDANKSLATNIEHFFSCLYFSVVTFTTLGYGDVTPQGATRAIAAMEAFAGSFTMALFVVVFVKKMTR